MNCPAFVPAPLLAAAAVGGLRGSGGLSLSTPLRRAFGSTFPAVAAPRRKAIARSLSNRRSAATMSVVDAPSVTGVVYVKAGPDGTSVGDCPFSLKVLLAAALKGVEVDVVPVDLSDKPASFLALTEAGSTPVFVHDGRTLTDSGEIVKYMDTLGSSTVTSLFAPLAAADASVADAVGGVFGAFARLMKNKEAKEEATRVAALEDALAAVNGVLEAGGGPFLVGPWVSALDCDLIPKMQHVVAAAGHYKGFSLAGHGWDALEQYVLVTGRMKATRKVLVDDDVVVWGWSKFF